MNGEKKAKRLSILLCELFAAATVLLLLLKKRYDRLPLAFWTMVLILLPEIAERVLRCRISTPIRLFARLYALGPMLGHCYNLYYRLNWWDKLLHISGGVLFALLGVFLFGKMGGRGLLCSAVFALCFSVAVSAIWEFIEFSADRLFDADMQNDTVLTEIHSYELGKAIGEKGTRAEIHETAINGMPLPFDGYLDIGLIDTMWDMILESLGALVTAVLLVADRGRHHAFSIAERTVIR